jgi:hypothetical protein
MDAIKKQKEEEEVFISDLNVLSDKYIYSEINGSKQHLKNEINNTILKHFAVVRIINFNIINHFLDSLFTKYKKINYNENLSKKENRYIELKTRRSIIEIKHTFITSLTESLRYKKSTSETTIKNKIETLNTININSIHSRMLEMGMNKEEIAKLRNKSVRALSKIEKVYNEKIYQAQNDKIKEKTIKRKITNNNKQKNKKRKTETNSDSNKNYHIIF